MDSQSLDAFNISQFCEQHSISRSAYYDMEKQGKGPRTFSIGGKGKGKRISKEAAADWRKQREAAA